MHKIDAGHNALKQISRTAGQLDLADANEAETRLKLIDDILVSVLGWTKEDIKIEERVSEDGTTEFCDYVLRTATTTILVEAKRVGAAFRISANRKSLKLGGVLSEGELGKAIRQARDYCRKKSIQFAVVTNGNVWVVFPAIRIDEVSFEETHAHIFRGLDDITERLVEFWELLSRERVIEGNLENSLLGRIKAADEERCVRRLMSEPGFRLGRNALYDHLEPAIALALSDEAILQDPDALSRCYIKTSERVKFDQRIRMHLPDRIVPLGHPTTRVRSKKNASKFEDVLARGGVSSPPRFLVVLGPVGAGKTTFLHHTRKVSAADAIDGRVLWMLVDFKRATKADSPRTFVYEKLLNLIESDKEFDLGDWEHSIRPAYRDEIENLRRGPLRPLADSDPKSFEVEASKHIRMEREAREPYVDKLLRYAGLKRPGYLIIDNVDQIEDENVQAQIFAEAQALARRIGFNVIMSLRETTYQRHRQHPTFDAFQFESFYIDPPNVLPVLSHRFAYARHILQGREATFQGEKGINVKVSDLGLFFETLSRSILDNDSGQMIEALAGGNIRRGLLLIRNFLASGHTNADRAIAAVLKGDGYKFPPHEIFKGAVLGASRYFDEKQAELPNIFDAKLGGAGAQLLRFKIVEYLVEKASAGPYDGALIADIVGTMQRLGINEPDVFGALKLLSEKALIRTTDGLPAISSSTIIPTQLGGYFLRALVTQFAYVEFCAFDTVVYDDDAWDELEALTYEIEQAHRLSDKIRIRIQRARRFLEYCRLLEERWSIECRRRDIEVEWHRPTIGKFVIAQATQSMNVAYESAISREGGIASDDDLSAVEHETCSGTIERVWQDKDYVFIRDEDEMDWLAHRNGFLSEDEWSRRGIGKPCLFVRGTWRGKPRAVAVRMAPRVSKSMPITRIVD